MTKIKIGIITDIHCGPDTPTRPGTRAPELLQRFVDDMNDRFFPDVVLDLGDRVQQDAGEEHAVAVRERFERIEAPVYSLFGNHDLDRMSRDDHVRIFGGDLGFRSFDLKGVHFVLLDTQDPTLGGVGGAISETQLRWLEDDLGRSDGPVVVFSHHPLDEQDVGANFHFDPFPHWARAANREQVRACLERSRRVVACFAGHVHWANRTDIGGIPYFTVPSLIECWQEGAEPQGGYAKVVLHGPRSVHVTFAGRPDPFRGAAGSLAHGAL